MARITKIRKEKLSIYLARDSPLAGHRPVCTLPRTDGLSVLLVPGLFCPPAVLNDLALALAERGLDVHLPSAFPYEFGALAGTAGVEPAADRLERDLHVLRQERGVTQIHLVAHSMGALVALEVLRRGSAELQIASLVTLGAPLRGAPLARFLSPLVPACRELSPGSPTLERLAPLAHHINRALVSGADLLVPEASQPQGPCTVRLEGFQHMDFFVGSKDKVARTADLIVESIRRPNPTPCLPPEKTYARPPQVDRPPLSKAP